MSNQLFSPIRPAGSGKKEGTRGIFPIPLDEINPSLFMLASASATVVVAASWVTVFQLAVWWMLGPGGIMLMTSATMRYALLRPARFRRLYSPVVAVAVLPQLIGAATIIFSPGAFAPLLILHLTAAASIFGTFALAAVRIWQCRRATRQDLADAIWRRRYYDVVMNDVI